MSIIRQFLTKNGTEKQVSMPLRFKIITDRTNMYILNEIALKNHYFIYKSNL
jgi:hypothetical protein